MKECPKCHELNGNGRTDCWKCHASLGPQDTYKKICTKCGLLYSPRAELCDRCGGPLSVYSEDTDQYTSGGSSGNTWMYVLTVLIPFIGIILGCIQLGKNENQLGKNLIILGVVLLFVYSFLSVALASCMLR